VSIAKLDTPVGTLTLLSGTRERPARNPIPIVLPCHRVVGANGALTGYGVVWTPSAYCSSSGLAFWRNRG
jgi:6-O-methylguanine DNA methyltransferase, DNA binding domain